MQLNLFPVRPRGAHALGAVDGLVGGGGQHKQLVPLVGQQLGVDVHGEVRVEGQSAGPLDQLVHDGVADLAQLLLEVRAVLVQQLANVLRKEKREASVKLV